MKKTGKKKASTYREEIQMSSRKGGRKENQ
jgi:hypothetical protein